MEIHPRYQEPSESEQEIVISRNPDRSNYVGYAVVFLVLLLCFSLVFVVFLVKDISMLGYLGFRYFDYGGSLKMYFFLFVFMLLYGSVAWQIISRHILIQGPPLIIDHLGMHLGTLPLALDQLTLPWEQIGTISLRRFSIDTYLCLCPKRPKEFLSNLGLWDKFIAHLNYLVLGAPVVVPQSTMNCTAQQVLNLLRERYASTLDDHAIVLKF